MYPHAVIFSAYVLLRRGPLKRLLVHPGAPILHSPPWGQRAALAAIPMHLYAVLEELCMYRLIHRVPLLLIVMWYQVFLGLLLVVSTLESRGRQGSDCPSLSEGRYLLVIHLYFI